MKRVNEESEDVDIGKALGATPDEVSTQVLSLYIPNKDRDNKEFGTQRKWVLEAGRLLAEIGGGFTIMPPVEGGWVNPNAAQIILENPVVIYTYVKPKEFVEKLPLLREFLHRMGRETGQGEVAVEFDGRFYRISNYDPPKNNAAAEAEIETLGYRI